MVIVSRAVAFPLIMLTTWQANLVPRVFVPFGQHQGGNTRGFVVGVSLVCYIVTCGLRWSKTRVGSGDEIGRWREGERKEEMARERSRGWHWGHNYAEPYTSTEARRVSGAYLIPLLLTRLINY